MDVAVVDFHTISSTLSRIVHRPQLDIDDAPPQRPESKISYQASPKFYVLDFGMLDLRRVSARKTLEKLNSRKDSIAALTSRIACGSWGL
jgi:hypothetical protein